MRTANVARALSDPKRLCVLETLATGERSVGELSRDVGCQVPNMSQHLAETALAVVGEASPLEGKWSRQWLWSKAASIAGGTSEVQRTIIGERMLGLPR